jgi:rubrerythrin
MNPVQALKLALGKEEAAIKTYQEFLITYPALGELFSFLITEEQKHKALIEKKILDLTRY